MTSPPKKSCYVVELSVSPGGSRWAELHAYTEPAHLRAMIERFCENDGGMSAYYSIWYGAVLGVWTLQHGEVAAFLDLHPHIRARIGDWTAVPLADEEGCRRLMVKWRRVQGGDPDEEDGEDDSGLDDDLLRAFIDEGDDEAYEQVKFEADWGAIAARLPALDPPLLGPRESTAVARGKAAPGPDDTSLYAEVRFGSYHGETGERLDGPDDLADADA
jgi:hypothetical protein